ncbi:MAG TPA: VOC family protein [Herpetosiphonaceae bacterium]|nr:VOC family protein [Herpetosiphonaceae bacterium]
MSGTVNTQLRWRGAHHLALVTRDLDATVRFYHGLLDMPLLAAMEPMPYHGRHCFFAAGSFLMHFFEDAGAEIAAPPHGWERNRITFVPGAAQHIAVSLEDETDLVALRERLMAAGVAVTEMMNQGPLLQFLFVDNNGLMIEANWSPVDLATQPIDYGNSRLFNDPHPVPAVKELMQTGRLQS